MCGGGAQNGPWAEFISKQTDVIFIKSFAKKTWSHHGPLQHLYNSKSDGLGEVFFLLVQTCLKRSWVPLALPWISFLEGTWLGKVGLSPLPPFAFRRTPASCTSFFLRRSDVHKAGDHLALPSIFCPAFLSSQIRWAETFLRGKSHSWEALRGTGEARGPGHWPPTCCTSWDLQGGGLAGQVSGPHPEGPGGPLARERMKALLIPFLQSWFSVQASHPPPSFRP